MSYPNFQLWRQGRPLWERPSLSTLRFFALILQALPLVVEQKGEMSQVQLSI